MRRDTWPTGSLREVVTVLSESPGRDDWPNVLVVGTLLTLTAGHLLPALALVGYAVRVLRSGLTGTPRLPGFDDWTGLFREAVPATGILLAYQALPLAAATVLLGATPWSGGFGVATSSPVGVATSSPVGVATGGLGVTTGVGTTARVGAASAGHGALAALAGAVKLLVAGVVVLVLGALASYLSLLALTNYVRTGSVRAGFERRVLERAATRPQNGALWLVCAGSAAVVAGLASVLAAVPVAGRLLGAALGFVGLVATVNLWGREVGTPTGRGVSPPTGQGQSAAATAAGPGDGSGANPQPRQSVDVE